MEEADVLCNRIGIVADGILRCVAPQVRLKSIYGGGYHLFINCQKGKVLQLLRRLKRKKEREQEKRKNAEEKIIMSGLREESKHAEGPASDDEDKDEEADDDATIIQRVADFIKAELPTSVLIREFNGSFVYQVTTHHSSHSLFRFPSKASRPSDSTRPWRRTDSDSGSPTGVSPSAVSRTSSPAFASPSDIL